MVIQIKLILLLSSQGTDSYARVGIHGYTYAKVYGVIIIIIILKSLSMLIKKNYVQCFT